MIHYCDWDWGRDLHLLCQTEGSQPHWTLSKTKILHVKREDRGLLHTKRPELVICSKCRELMKVKGLAREPVIYADD